MSPPIRNLQRDQKRQASYASRTPQEPSGSERITPRTPRKRKDYHFARVEYDPGPHYYIWPERPKTKKRRPHSRHITRDMLKQELNETIISTAAKSTQQQVATISNDPLAQQDLPGPSHQPPLTATVPSDESAPPEIRKVSRFTVQRIQNALQPPINPSTAQQSPVFTPPAIQTNQNQSSTPSSNESARPPAQRRSRFTVNKVPESALQSQSAPPTANNPPTTGLESNQPAQAHAPLEFSQQIASQQPNAALQFSASPLFRLPTQNMTPTLSVVVEEPENEDAEQVQPESALRETNKRPLLSTPATPMIPVGGGKDDSNRANSFLTQSSVDKNVSPWTTLLVSPGEALLSFVVEHPTDHRPVPSPQDTTPQLHNAPQHNQHRVTTKFNELYEKVIDECNQTEAIFERFANRLNNLEKDHEELQKRIANRPVLMSENED